MKDCSENNKIILKSEQRFRSDTYNVFTYKVNKIALKARVQVLEVFAEQN